MFGQLFGVPAAEHVRAMVCIVGSGDVLHEEPDEAAGIEVVVDGDEKGASVTTLLFHVSITGSP